MRLIIRGKSYFIIINQGYLLNHNMEKPKSCSRFQDSWLKMEEFSWVARGKNASYANCKLCDKEIDLKSMGRQALKVMLMEKYISLGLMVLFIYH